MNLELPLKEPTSDIDYTTVDNLIFSKDMSGLERMQLIVSVFSNHYKVKAVNGRLHDTIKDMYVKISERVTLSLRAYKHIVVCIVGKTTSGFGSNSRNIAEQFNRLFEEKNRVFPFRAVLEKVRELKKEEDELNRKKELEEQEMEFKFLKLEGTLLMDFGIPGNKISRCYSYCTGDEIKINITLPNAGYGTWTKTSIGLNEHDEDKLNIILAGGLSYYGVSKEDAIQIFKPLFDYTFNIPAKLS